MNQIEVVMGKTKVIKKKNKVVDTLIGLMLGVGFTVFLILVIIGFLSIFDDGAPMPLNYDRVYEARMALGQLALKLLAFGGVVLLVRSLYLRYVKRINNLGLLQAGFAVLLFIVPYFYYYW
jgi:hypothetical protein